MVKLTMRAARFKDEGEKAAETGAETGVAAAGAGAAAVVRSVYEDEGRRRPRERAGAFDCLVVGVGGQGVVLASRLVASACMAKGDFVRTAETIGMSQRGGGVATHVRVAASASDLPTSMIPLHGANLVLAFEPGEALRAYDRLAPGGALVCAGSPVVPSTALASGYDGVAQLDWLRAHVGEGRLAVVDTGVLVREGLSPRCANVLLAGAAVGLGALPFGVEELREAVRSLVKPAFVAMNERALELGVETGCASR